MISKVYALAGLWEFERRARSFGMKIEAGQIQLRLLFSTGELSIAR